MSNSLTYADVLAATHWIRPDARLVPEGHRHNFIRRCAALATYIQGASVRSSCRAHNVNRETLRSIIEKAFRLGSDGRQVGYRACLPYSVRTVRNKQPDTPVAGNSHSLDQLFGAHPDIQKMLDNYKGALPEGRLPPDFVRLIGSIRQVLIERKCQSRWPLNTRDRGRRVFSRYLKRQRRQAIVDGAPSAPSPEIRPVTRLDELFSLRPFDRVEFDAHRMDVNWRLLVPNARGDLVAMPISAIWILAIIEVVSTAVVGWKIVVGRSYSALDVAQCFATAMRPWEPRLLVVPELQYVPSASMPSNLDMTTPPPMGRLTAMDNAKAHKAKMPLDAWLKAHYGVLNFGLPHVPEARPHIEQFFHRLEVGALRLLPGGFKPHRINQPAISTSAWSSNDHPVHLQALEDLLDVVITGHNVSPLPARQNRTPIEILSTYQDSADYWIAPPYNEGNAKALTTTCHRVTIKGSKNSNKPVRVQFLQVDYRHPDLDKAWEMVGQSYQAMIDYEDLRTITLVDDSLRPVRTLYAADPWRRHRHDITTRRRILALSRSGELVIQGADSAVAAYAAFTLAQAGQSAAAADQAARLMQLAYGGDVADTDVGDDTQLPESAVVMPTSTRALPVKGPVSFTDVEEIA